MYSKQDIIDYLIEHDGVPDTETYSYPIIHVVKGDIGYIFHMVDSDLMFVRDTFDMISKKKIAEHTILYHTVEEYGIDITMKEF